MKKYFFAVILLVVSSAFLAAEADSDTGLKIKIAETMEAFSRAWLEAHPDPVSKQGAAVLEIENNSNKAKNGKIGELVRAYLEEAMDRSLIFTLTDRKNIDRIVDEIKFSASGMVSDDSAVEIGEITGTAVLISGGVAEEGADFRIQLRLTEIASGEVLTVFGFSLPQKDLIAASTEHEYGYVAANGIGLSVKPVTYLYGAETFNKFKPVFIDAAVKYRFSRELMVSGGLLTNMLTSSDLYRWDPDLYPSQAPVLYRDIQTELPAGFNTGREDVGQITGALTSALATHLDFQYTINFSPVFNIGINAGVIGFVYSTLEVLYGSRGDLFFDNQSYDNTGVEGGFAAQKDKMPMDYIFEMTGGAKIEICPEFFVTHRIAVSGVVGYMYILPATLRQVKATEGEWAYYPSAVESNYSEGTIDKYFGFNPLNMPGGGTWTLDFSGFYAGLSLSVFF